MLNKVMIIGRLGKDPELRYTQGGVAFASFNVATDESYTDRDGNKQDKTEWHRIVVFQRQAENCANFLSKGSLVYIEGSLQTRKWQDQDGQDRFTTEIKAQRVQFLDRKGDRRSEDGADYGMPQEQGYKQGYAPRQQPRSQRQGEDWDSQPRQSKQPKQPQSSPQAPEDEDIGPVFPSEAATMSQQPSMDQVPF